MVKAPAVSIAIRGWRHDAVGGAIDSVLAQGFADLELVLYDDTGGALAGLAAARADPRLRYVRATERHTASGRWLAAWRACRAPVIGLLDDDDRYRPDFVARLHAVLQAQPEVGIAFARDANRVAGAHVPPGPQRDVASRMLRQRWGVPTSTMLIRRAAHDDALRLAPMGEGVSPDLFVAFHVAQAGWQLWHVDEPLCERSGAHGRISGSATGAGYALATFEQLRCAGGEQEVRRRREVERRRVVFAAQLLGAARVDEARAQLRRPAGAQMKILWRVQRAALRLLACAPQLAAPLLRGLARGRARWRRA